MKTASSGLNKKAGDAITYTFTVTNTGNVTVSSVKVSDPKLGLTNFALNPSTLLPGQIATGSANYTITAADMSAGSVLNTATAKANAPNGASVTDVSDSSSTSGSNPTIVILNTLYPPVAVDDSTTTAKDTPVTIDIKANDSDPDHNNPLLSPAIITEPKNGTAIIGADGKMIYTPRNNFTGRDTITYKICDPTGLCDTAIVIVNILPVAEPMDIIVRDTSFCSNGIAILKATSTTISNPVFTWYSDAAFTNRLFVGDTYVTNSLSSTTNFYIRVSGTGVLPNLVNNGKLVTVTIYPAPARPTMTTNGSLAICVGDSLKLTSSPAASYQWYKNNFALSGATSQILTVNSPGTYSVVVFNSNGCPSQISTSSVVSVNPTPLAPLISTNLLNICNGSNAVLTSSISTGNQWYKNGLLISGATNATYNATTAGSYSVVSTNASGCNSAFSNAISINVYSLPSQPLISVDGPLKKCKDDIRKLSVIRPSGSIIQWYKDNNLISGAVSDTLVITQAGAYHAIISNANGCSSLASPKVIIEIVCTEGYGLPDIFTPDGDGVNEEIKPYMPGLKKLRCFKVYNRWGNLIFETTDPNKGWDGKFRGANQPADNYIWLIEGVDTAGKDVKKTGMFILARNK